jgi:PAS domain S-box-containing protein
VHDFFLGQIDFSVAIYVFVFILCFAACFPIAYWRRLSKELLKENECLRKSREGMQLILNSVGEAIYGIDLDGNCTFCNPACIRLLGYSDPAELIGKNMHRLCHHSYSDGRPFPVDQCRIFLAFLQGENSHADDEVMFRMDGSAFQVEYWSFPQKMDGKIIGAVVAFVDITARKKVERALLDSEERYRYIASAITDYIYTVYIENGQPVRTNYSTACLAVTGYTSDEFRADPMLWIKVVPDEDRPCVRQQISQILSGRNEIDPIEYRIVHKDGLIRWVKDTIVLHRDSQGVLVSYDGLITDITARREAESILENQKKVLDEHAIVSRTDARGRITYVNNKFCEISKFTREELIGKTHAIVNSGYHPRIFFDNLWRTISSGKVWEGNVRNRAKDGTLYWVRSTIVPFMDENGHVKEYISARTDITKNIENEQRLEEAMQVKTNFVSTVSHELRTPLASIKSSVDILDTEVPGKLTTDQRIFLGRVKSNIDRLARLINDVLDLSKLESGKMSMNLGPLTARDVVKDVVELQRIVVKSKPIALETSLGDDLPVFLADKDRLTQVLNNLIGNALKFTKEGCVTISVSNDGNNMIRFAVSDTGTGIKSDDLPKLFQKFQQVGGISQQVSGTGLGLAISKEIIERHGGRIWVESEPGKGSSFIFLLPIKQNKRILVVDDDPGTLQLIKTILDGTRSYNIEIAGDGFIAGQKYLEFDPHLIILDIGLPKLSGLEVCSRIKRGDKGKQSKIIMISSFNEETMRRSFEAGADQTLNKPINPGELISRV